jgi:hypothetical protein
MNHPFSSLFLLVGDIHGDYPALTKILRKASLIDLKGQWIGGETILVQTGDIVDRGVDTIACYKFMQTLTSQAEKSGGTVVSLLGNHEIVSFSFLFFSFFLLSLSLVISPPSLIFLIMIDECIRRLEIC